MTKSPVKGNDSLKMVFLFSILIELLIASSTFAVINEINFSNSNLDEVMKYIAQVENVNVAYPSDLSTLKVSVNLRNVDIETVFRLILLPYHVNYRKVDERTYVLFREGSDRIPKFSSGYETKYLSPQKLSETLNELGIDACLAQNRVIFFFDNEEEYKDILSKIEILDVESKKELLLYNISYISKEDFTLSTSNKADYKDILASFLKSNDVSTNSKSVKSGFITFLIPELNSNVENESSKIAELKIDENMHMSITGESSGIILWIKTDTDEISVPYDKIDSNGEFMFESSTTIYYLKLWKHSVDDSPSISTIDSKFPNSPILSTDATNMLINNDKAEKCITLSYISSSVELQFDNQINTFLLASTSTSYTQFSVNYMELGTDILDGFGVGFRYDFADSSFSIFGMDRMRFDPFYLSIKAYYNFDSTSSMPLQFKAVLGLKLSLDRYSVNTSIEFLNQDFLIFHLLVKGTFNDQEYGAGINANSKGEVGLLLSFAWK